MFSKSDFQAWGKADNAVLFAAVMTKIEGRKDDELLRTYGFRGFPSLAILDASGKAITKKVQRSLDSMSSLVKKSKRHVALANKVEAGEPYNKKAWFLSRLDMGMLDLAKAKEEMASLELGPKQMKRAGKVLFALELEQMRGKWMAQMRARGRRGANKDGDTGDAPKPIDVEGFVYKSFKAGKRLPKGHGMLGYFDSQLIAAAKKNKDAEAFLFSYPRVRATYAANLKRMEAMLPRYEKMEGERAEMMLGRIKNSVTNYKKMVADLDAMAETMKK